MRRIEELLSHYSDDHQNPENQRMHLVCVPLIVWTVMPWRSLSPAKAIRSRSSRQARASSFTASSVPTPRFINA